MESEKVKEIKKALECCTTEELLHPCEECPYTNDCKCEVTLHTNILTLINELEGENERLSDELDSEWKERRKAEEDLHKAQWNYKIGLGQSQNKNAKLKDRIAELEKENEELKQDLKKSIDMQREMIDSVNTATKEIEENLAREIPNLLKQFAGRFRNYDEFILRADDDGALFYIDLVEWLNDTLKEFINE